MVKKFFALASVTAVSGLLVAVAGAGCSSTTTTTESDAGDASRDVVTRPPTPDGGEIDSGPQGPTCASKKTFSVANIKAEYRFKPTGGAIAGACSDAMIAQIKSVADAAKAAKKPVDWKEDIVPLFADAGAAKQACLDCIGPEIGEEDAGAADAGDGTQWRAAQGAFGSNFVGCGVRDGELPSDACAEAVYDINLCFAITCEKCTSDTDNDECVGWAQQPGNPCGDVTAKVGSKCPTFDPTAQKAFYNGQCSSYDGVVKAFCGTGAK